MFVYRGFTVILRDSDIDGTLDYLRGTPLVIHQQILMGLPSKQTHLGKYAQEEQESHQNVNMT